MNIEITEKIDLKNKKDIDELIKRTEKLKQKKIDIDNHNESLKKEKILDMSIEEHKKKLNKSLSYLASRPNSLYNGDDNFCGTSVHPVLISYGLLKEKLINISDDDSLRDCRIRCDLSFSRRRRLPLSKA